mmetsp:Transcript_33353/g.38644  ORF Transcript_33353/g.38644 Transcript_33353/m.38644 type:complete len:419 (+) Transcript_33353:132-1388(+)
MKASQSLPNLCFSPGKRRSTQSPLQTNSTFESIIEVKEDESCPVKSNSSGILHDVKSRDLNGQTNKTCLFSTQSRHSEIALNSSNKSSFFRSSNGSLRSGKSLCSLKNNKTDRSKTNKHQLIRNRQISLHEKDSPTKNNIYIESTLKSKCDPLVRLSKGTSPSGITQTSFLETKPNANIFQGYFQNPVEENILLPSKGYCIINSTLPDRLNKQNQFQIIRNQVNPLADSEIKAPLNPSLLLISVLKANGYNYKPISSLSLNGFFITPSEEQMASYGHDLIEAVRNQDINYLRSCHLSGTKSLQCCNRFGESLIHMACRRGFLDVVSFLTQEAKVSLRVIDDCGRTPMHDACWTCKPSFELLDLLISTEPDLMIMSDKRGNTPFDYVRREHWSHWANFIETRKSKITLRDFPCNKTDQC